MRVSVDIDDVVVDFTGGWQPIYENYFGIEVDGPVDGWDVTDFTHFGTKGEFFSWWERIDGWSQLGWVPGARAACDWIASRPGWGLVFSTARGTPNGITAANRLGGRDGVWPSARVNTNMGDKTIVPAGIHIDDGPHIAEQFVAAGKPMILFDRPWNQDVEALAADEYLVAGHDGPVIVRAFSWAEVTELLGSDL